MKEENIGLGTLEDIFGVHIGLAHTAMVQDFKRELEPLQLTPKQAALLWLADAHPGIAQIDVARVLRVDRATMLGITNSVTRRHLIARGTSRSEGGRGGRRIGLHVTPAGRDLLVQAKQAIARHEKRIKSRLTEREVRVAVEILKKIYQ